VQSLNVVSELVQRRTGKPNKAVVHVIDRFSALSNCEPARNLFQYGRSMSLEKLATISE
jgi:hypothetical protein